MTRRCSSDVNSPSPGATNALAPLTIFRSLFGSIMAQNLMHTDVTPGPDALYFVTSMHCQPLGQVLVPVSKQLTAVQIGSIGPPHTGATPPQSLCSTHGDPNIASGFVSGAPPSFSETCASLAQSNPASAK